MTTLPSITSYYFPSVEVLILKEIITGSLFTVTVSSLNCVLIYWRMYSLLPPPPIHLAYVRLFACRMLYSRWPLGFDPTLCWLAGVFRDSRSGRFAPTGPQEWCVFKFVSTCVSVYASLLTICSIKRRLWLKTGICSSIFHFSLKQFL